MELLAGARAGEDEHEIRRTVFALPVLPLLGLADFELAAEYFRGCRTSGETIRDTVDCLVAVPVIRAEATLLHADRDFDVLARHTPLEVEPLLA